MEIGVRIPCYRAWVRGAEVGRLAARAEALGFDSLWVHDHLVAPAAPVADVVPMGDWMGAEQHPRENLTAEQYYAADNWWLDPFAVWGFLCSATTRVRLASDIIVVPYRNPVVQAKLLGTLDVLSNGRMIFGVGTGHVESESRALGIDARAYAARGDVATEYIKVIIALLSNEIAGFEGEHYRLDPVKPMIRPVQQPHPPIYVGGHGKPALRRAAALGQAWLPSNLSPDEIRDGAAYLTGQCAAIGRAEPPTLALSLLLKLREGPPKGPRPGHTPEEAATLLNAYADVGVTHVSLDFPNRSEEQLLHQFELFATLVRPGLNSRPPP